MSAATDSSNQFAVGVRGDYVVITRVPIGQLTKPEAVNLAAWLMVLADPEGKEFSRVVEGIVTA